MFGISAKNKKYMHCDELEFGLHFYYGDIRVCCSDDEGLILYPDYDGREIDWNYVFKQRVKYLKEINSALNKSGIPKFCSKCWKKDVCMKDNPVSIPSNMKYSIKKVLFQNTIKCNADCIYCLCRRFSHLNGYSVLNAVKSMIKQEVLSKNADIYMSGGEITISNEFEELFSLLSNYLDSQIEIFTSGIKYSKAIENAFVKNKVRLLISLDSASSGTYKKIKRADCYDKVTANIKKYIAASENAKTGIILKYILLENINDNEAEIKAFIDNAAELGIKKVRLDFDTSRYNQDCLELPEHYAQLYQFFNEYAGKNNLEVLIDLQKQDILNKAENQKSRS